MLEQCRTLRREIKFVTKLALLSEGDWEVFQAASSLERTDANRLVPWLLTPTTTAAPMSAMLLAQHPTILTFVAVQRGTCFRG